MHTTTFTLTDPRGVFVHSVLWVGNTVTVTWSPTPPPMPPAVPPPG